MKHYLGVLIGLVLAVSYGMSPSDVQAGCVVESSATYIEGETIREDKCMPDGSKKVAVSLTTSALGECEDQTNHLCRTSGGPVRQTVIATNMVVGGDGLFKASMPVSTGWKTLSATMTGGGAISQLLTIYGSFNPVMTLTNSVKLGTITLNGTDETTGAMDPFTMAFPNISVVSSVTLGTNGASELTIGN